jgi:ELWxxDGT repeat protein
MVKDINPTGSGVAFSVDQFAMIDGLFYFVADDGVHGAELWRTDGSAGNATMVADLVPGPGSPRISKLAGARGKAFFFADDGVHGSEPWQSDGTAAGTTPIADLVPGAGQPVVTSYRGANGAYYFTADDGVHGPELWRTDGTPIGTILYDTIPGPAGAAPTIFTTDASGKLFMSGFDLLAGVEPLVLPDDVRPLAYGASFDAIAVRFSENVGASLVASDFVVTDRSTGAVRTPASVAFDAVRNIATLHFAARLPDGNYRVTLATSATASSAASVTR